MPDKAKPFSDNLIKSLSLFSIESSSIIENDELFNVNPITSSICIH